MKYGDYGGKSDAWLAKRHNKIVGELETLLNDELVGDANIKKLHELMELERELTLRESL